MCTDERPPDTSLPSTAISETFHTVYDGDVETLSVGVIEAIAEAMDIDQRQTEIPLDRSIDPDALDAIFADRYDGTSRCGSRVVFTVWESEVVVHSDGHIFIHPPDE